MFRESDYVPPTLHPTYGRKPKPEMQLRSEIAMFNAGSQAHEYANPVAEIASVPAVPTTYDTVFEPSHPDADWGVNLFFFFEKNKILFEIIAFHLYRDLLEKIF